MVYLPAIEAVGIFLLARERPNSFGYHRFVHISKRNVYFFEH